MKQQFTRSTSGKSETEHYQTNRPDSRILMPSSSQQINAKQRDAPPKCLSFTISGQWGHFRKIEGNIVKGTYKIIPRTTLSGLVAAILGLPRNSYYDLFTPENSMIAIEPKSRLRTINMAINSLSTQKEKLNTVNKGRKLKISFPDARENRQRHIYEVLVNPSYRVDIWLDNNEMYDKLRSCLEKGKSTYTPSLGISEHLATITYHGEFQPETIETQTGSTEIDSVVPDESPNIVPQPGSPHSIERSPSQMKKDGTKHRITTGSRTIAYNQGAEPLVVRNEKYATVDDRNVIFR